MFDEAFEQVLPISVTQLPSTASHYFPEILSEDQYASIRFRDGIHGLTDLSMASNASNSSLLGFDDESLLGGSSDYTASPDWPMMHPDMNGITTNESPMVSPLPQLSTLMHDSHSQDTWLASLPLELGEATSPNSPLASYFSPSASPPTAADQPAAAPRAARGRKRQALPRDPQRAVQMAKNRAAAERCRRKKKAWEEELEGRAREAAARHGALKAQVAHLQRVVLALKEQMVYHNGCADGRIREYLLAGVRGHVEAGARCGVRLGERES